MLKPAILLLPGLDGTGRLFRRLVPELEAFAVPVVISYPADRFLNYRQLTEQVLHQIPGGPFVILGESFSGPPAVQLALRKPPGLRGIILAASFVRPPVPRWLRFAPLGPVMRIRPPRFVLRRLLLDSTCGADFVAELAEAIASVAPSILAARVREVLSTDVSDGLRGCPVPVACLVSARDRLVGPGSLGAIRECRPDVEVVTLDAPHLLLQTQPKAAAVEIKKLLERW